MSGTESSSATDTVSAPPVELSPEAAAQIQSRCMLLGLFAAVTYSVANLALRSLSKTDGGTGWDMWVAGTKAFPTFAVAIFLFTRRRLNGLTTFPEWSLVWPIAVAALFNQLGGNFAFQMSLRAIGLAISVPICFSTIICSGAVMGRIILKDQVSVRTAISIGLMIASIAFLSSSATSRASDTPETMTRAALSVPAGVALSMFSAVVDNIREFGTLKAMGARMVDLVALLIVQAICYATVGSMIGLFLATRMAEGIRSPELALVLPTWLILGSAAGMVVLCIMASILALLRVRSVEPGMVFR